MRKEMAHRLYKIPKFRTYPNLRVKLPRAYAVKKSARICIVHWIVSNFVSVSHVSIRSPDAKKKRSRYPDELDLKRMIGISKITGR